jgi:hypothetical protein
MLDPNCKYTSFLCGKGTFYISLAVLVLFVLNCSMLFANRMLQGEVLSLQQTLNQKNARTAQNQAFGNIYQNILQALANAAVNKGDGQIKKLLDDNGLKVEKTAPGAARPAAPAGAAPTAPAPAPAATE